MSGWSSRTWAVAWACACTAATASAQPAPDRQVWTQVLAIGQVGDWRTHLEVQPRFMDDASETGLTIVRTALGRRLTPRLTAWLGHAWVPRTLGTGTRHEQRVWQQVSYAGPSLGPWTPTARLRVEQRWLAPWDGTSHRVRLLARAQRPLGTATPWALFTYDEAMFTLDDTPRGPARGFDRNRLAAGVVRRLSPVVSSDVGYIWETSRTSSGRRNDHIVLAVLSLSVPR